VLALAQAGICELAVCAPAAEQSAQSQALSLRHNAVVADSALHPEASGCFAVHGSPADSVLLAQRGGLFVRCSPLGRACLSGMRRQRRHAIQA